MPFCSNSTGIVELAVNGLGANVGIGTVACFSLSSIVSLVFILSALETVSRFPCASSDEILWKKSRRESNVENRFPKTFSCTIKWQSVIAAEQRTRTRNHSKLNGNVRHFLHKNLIQYRGRIVQRIHLFPFGKWTVELSRDSLLIFAWRIKLLYLRSLHFSDFVHFEWIAFLCLQWFLLQWNLFPTRFNKFVLYVLHAMPFCAPPFVVFHRCTYWVTRHEVLFWLDLILPHSAKDLCCFRADFHSYSTDWRFRKQKSTFGFSVLDVFGENNAAGFPKAPWSSDEWDVCALSILSWENIAFGFPDVLWACTGP